MIGKFIKDYFKFIDETAMDRIIVVDGNNQTLLANRLKAMKERKDWEKLSRDLEKLSQDWEKRNQEVDK